ncbi:hypothetical protein [Streptomyces sp. CB03911]|uniref:hypothetical protein n=1 Tax=Streptomycetaceae TaxID=2062 RepID=UPI00093D1466|nr:hypothetical protein [Streptomyces sp. CB03911]OKI16023.1 hypothetical protein A6A07_40830 [Streptomyces sp. CB03911]
MLAVDRNPDDYHRTFEEKVHELIAAKQDGQEVTAPEAGAKGGCRGPACIAAAPPGVVGGAATVLPLVGVRCR